MIKTKEAENKRKREEADRMVVWIVHKYNPDGKRGHESGYTITEAYKRRSDAILYSCDELVKRLRMKESMNDLEEDYMDGSQLEDYREEESECEQRLSSLPSIESLDERYRELVETCEKVCENRSYAIGDGCRYSYKTSIESFLVNRRYIKN